MTKDKSSVDYLQKIPIANYFEKICTLQFTEVEITLEEAIDLLFKILNISKPSKEQQQFAKAEIMLARSHNNFKRLVILLSGLMGNLENYFAVRYQFISKK